MQPLQQHRLASQKKRPKPTKAESAKYPPGSAASKLDRRWLDHEKLLELKQDDARLAAFRKETIAAFPKLPIKSLARVGQASLKAGFGRSSLQYHLDMRWFDFWRALDVAAQQQLALPEQESDPQDLVSLACSFAEARYAAPEVLGTIASRLVGELDSLRPRDVTMTTRALAILGVQARARKPTSTRRTSARA